MEKYTIEEICSIKELVDKQKQLYENTKEIRSMFEASSKMYNDKCAFVLELIQNADDANASEITFNVGRDKVEIKHNGDYFTLNDIERISKADQETNVKNNDYSKIGQFGIGFKSVYNVTDTPNIKSGKYEFEIQDYVKLKFISPNITSASSNLDSILYDSTIITLPFLNKDIYQEICNKLYQLDENHIIFLNKIEKIIIKTEEEKYIIEKKSISDINLHDGINFFGFRDKKYCIIDGSFLNNDKYYKTVKLGFEINNDNGIIEFNPIQYSNFYVFFPTATPTGLGFMIQGKYSISMNRKELSEGLAFINDNDIKINKIVEEIISKLFDIFSFYEIDKVSLLETLLFTKNKETPYSKKIHKLICENIIQSDYILLSENSITNNNIVFVSDKIIKKILECNVVYNNFKWIDDVYIKFFTKFKELVEINYFDFDKLIAKIRQDNNFVELTNIQYLYQYLLQNKDKIIDLDFIKTDNGSYTSYNNSQLYDRDETICWDSVHQELGEELGLEFIPVFLSNSIDKNSREILAKPPLTNYVVVAFIENKYFHEKENQINNVVKYFKGLNLILKFSSLCNYRGKNSSIMMITKNTNPEGAPYLKQQMKDVYYIENPILKEIYIESKAISLSSFVDIELYDKYINPNYRDEFFKFIFRNNIKTSFVQNEEITMLSINVSFYNKQNQKRYEERQKQNDYYNYNVETYNPSILKADHILNFLVKNTKKDYSIAFFGLILEFFQKTPKIKGWFNYYYFTWKRIELVEIDLFTLLKEKKWILIENKMYKCNEISLKMLMDEGYLKGDIERSLNILCEVLEISPGEISTTAKNVITSLNQLSSSELIFIQSKLEEKITNNDI